MIYDTTLVSNKTLCPYIYTAILGKPSLSVTSVHDICALYNYGNKKLSYKPTLTVRVKHSTLFRWAMRMLWIGKLIVMSKNLKDQ